MNKVFAKNIVKESLESLKHAYFKLFFEKSISQLEEIPCSQHSTKSDNSEKYFMNIYRDDEEEKFENSEVVIFKINNELEKEISILTELICNKTLLKSIKSTKDFWKINSDKLPKLKNLSVVLLNISASSAFIERFFSIAGVICKNRASNMKDDLIIMRSMLKTNIELLNELND